MYRFTALVLISLVVILSFHNRSTAFQPIPQPSAQVLSVAFSPDGKLLVSGGWDGTARVWKVSSGKPVKILDFQHGPVRGLCFDPSGKVLAACGGVIKLWDATGWKKIRVMEDSLPIGSIAFEPSGDSLISVGWRGIRVWDLKTGRLWWQVDEHCLGLGVTADGRHMVCGGSEYNDPPGHPGMACFGAVRLWDVKERRQVFSLGINDIDLRNVAISPDGSLIATGGWGESVGILDVPSRKVLCTLPTTGGPGEVSVAFGPDGRLLAYGCADGTARIYSLSQKRMLAVLRGHKGDIECLSFSPDGRILASGGEDGLVMLWDVASGKRLYILRGHKKVLPE